MFRSILDGDWKSNLLLQYDKKERQYMNKTQCIAKERPFNFVTCLCGDKITCICMVLYHLYLLCVVNCCKNLDHKCLKF